MSGREPVVVDFRKWPDLPHWRLEMMRLGEDEHGTWLGAMPGHWAAKGDEPPVRFDHAAVKLIPAGAWWTAIWNDGGRIALYVDVVTPPAWEGSRVRMIDLDLDVVRRRDGRVELLDEDEFLENAPAYPERVVDRARATAAALVLAVGRRQEPFGTAAERWMARLTGEKRREQSPFTSME